LQPEKISPFSHSIAAPTLKPEYGGTPLPALSPLRRLLRRFLFLTSPPQLSQRRKVLFHSSFALLHSLHIPFKNVQVGRGKLYKF
jgi:hypothetical protein